MAITISGQNNNDKIVASDGVLDMLSGFNVVGVMTASSFDVGSNIKLGNAGIITATTVVGNVTGNLTGNVNHTSNLLLQISGSEKFRVGTSGQFGIAGANYGTSGQVLTSGGSGSAPTWSTISGTTINNNAANKVIMGSNTANTLEAVAKSTLFGNLSHGQNFLDDQNLIFGDASDMILIHTSSGAKSRLRNTNDSGSLDIESTLTRFLNKDGSSEKARIDSSGRVLIGTTTEGGTGADNLTIATSGATGITIRSGTSSNGNLFFSDGTSGADEYRGVVQYNHTDNFLRFYTNGAEVLRINSSGNARLGGTSDTTDQGYRFTLQGSSNATYLQFFDNGTGTTHGSDGSFVGLINQDFYVWNREAKDVVIGSSNNERLRITSTGLLLGGTDASNNTTLGGNAGDSIASGGVSNTLIGKDAGTAISTGDNNTALGYFALKTMQTSAGCVAVGSNALQVCTGADNVAMGFAAGQQVAGGTNNCLIGSSAGLQIQAGTHNVAIGRDALRLGSSGNVNYNVVAGSYSLNQLTNAYNNVVLGYNCSGSGTMTGGTVWHSNVVIGYQAGNFVPSAASNTVIGKYTCGNAGHSLSDNIVMGTNAGKYLGNYSNNCVILGQEAAQNAGYGSGSNHAYAWTHSIAIGYRAFYNATGAPDAVVAVGSQALKEHKGDGDGSSGGYIVAVGQNCMSSTEHMRHSVAVGNDAGAYWNPAKSQQHEGGSVFVGGGAGRYGGTAPSLIAIGRDAGNASSANPMSGPHNVLIGSRAGEKIRDGENNTCIGGNYCALFLQTGDWNTILGSLAGYGYDTNNSIQSGSYCTQIGAYSKSSGASNNYENCFGYGITGKGANTTHIRGSAYNSNNSSSWSTTSDERIKKNIVDNNTGLDAIEKIRVRNFEYRTKNEITDFDNPDAVVVEKEGLQLGVIAQEIKDILPDVVKQNTTGAYAVDPDNLTWYLVNAVKELSAEVKSLKAQLNS